MDEHKRLEALLASLVELIKKDEKKSEVGGKGFKIFK
jgi:hypothetical protein